MYQGGRGAVLGASTTAGGVVLLPNTTGNLALRYAAITAISLGAIVVLLQLAVIIYKNLSER